MIRDSKGRKLNHSALRVKRQAIYVEQDVQLFGGLRRRFAPLLTRSGCG